MELPLRQVPSVPTWWRPSLDLMRLLDALASDAASPACIIASAAGLLAPALVRFPTARCLTIDPWSEADLVALPAVAAFVGTQPEVSPLAATAPQSFQTILWLCPTPPTATEIRHVATRLGPSAMLAVVLGATGIGTSVLPAVRLRRELRGVSLTVMQTIGYLGPRALAWSAGARFAMAVGRPDRYDRCHAAMRAAYAERWPLALLCRTVVVVATVSGPDGPHPVGAVPQC